MRHLIGYWKPYWKTICVILVLLIAQAFGELALPEYTSRIVDTGLQASGIEHAAPERISDRFVARAVDFIAAARISQLNAKAVIAASGASRSYLTKRFRAETGRSILEAIHLRMMKDVKRELLETEKSVAQIAGEMGFTSSSGLCSVFRRLNGISMSEFRNAQRLNRAIT